MDVNIGNVILRFAIAIAGGAIGSMIYVLLSTEDDLKKSIRKFAVGVLASGVFTGIALKYANLSSDQMDVWIAGAAAVGFAAWVVGNVVVKKMTAWAASWTNSSTIMPPPVQQPNQPPAAPISPAVLPPAPPATLEPSPQPVPVTPPTTVIAVVTEVRK